MKPTKLMHFKLAAPEFSRGKIPSRIEASNLKVAARNLIQHLKNTIASNKPIPMTAMIFTPEHDLPLMGPFDLVKYPDSTREILSDFAKEARSLDASAVALVYEDNGTCVVHIRSHTLCETLAFKFQFQGGELVFQDLEDLEDLVMPVPEFGMGIWDNDSLQ